MRVSVACLPLSDGDLARECPAEMERGPNLIFRIASIIYTEYCSYISFDIYNINDLINKISDNKLPELIV